MGSSWFPIAKQFSHFGTTSWLRAELVDSAPVMTKDSKFLGGAARQQTAGMGREPVTATLQPLVWPSNNNLSCAPLIMNRTKGPKTQTHANNSEGNMYPCGPCPCIIRAHLYNLIRPQGMNAICFYGPNICICVYVYIYIYIDMFARRSFLLSPWPIKFTARNNHAQMHGLSEKKQGSTLDMGL